MDKKLFIKGQDAIKKGLNWLSTNEEEIAKISDLSAHYKAPYLYAALGDSIRARHYANMMKNRYLQPGGDFRTSPDERGWGHLPCSPANRYVYPSGWIIIGLKRLGFYDTAKKGLEFVRRFQSPELGGFYSRFDISSDKVNTTFLDSSSTSSAGLALLACGYVDEARHAGDFILKLIEAQPEPDKYYFSSWETGTGLMTDIWGDENQNSLHGRKQFCLSAMDDPMGELTWLVGKPMKFLAKLYDETSEQKYLNGAVKLFDFFERLDDRKWDNLASCKVMWAGSELYRHTGEKRFAETAAKLLDKFCDAQDPSGTWLHILWYNRVGDQPITLNLDNVQELCSEISDTLFELYE